MIAPVIVTGNTCVVVASERAPLPSITLAEVLATSDLPAGVVNILTGSAKEIAPWLAAHMDVNALDLTGVGDANLADHVRAGGGGEPQAGPPPRRGRLVRRPRHRADDGLPGDQDRLAPHGGLTVPTGTGV